MDERARAVVRSAMPVLVDVGAPLAVFGALRLAGVATVPALVAAGSVSVVTIVVTVVRERRVSAQTVGVALLVAAGVGLSAVTHDPRFRFLLRRMTAVWGATWLVEGVLRVVIVYAFPLERVGTALVLATVAIPVLLTPAIVVSARDGRALQALGEGVGARVSARPASPAGSTV